MATRASALVFIANSCSALTERFDLLPPQKYLSGVVISRPLDHYRGNFYVWLRVVTARGTGT